MTDSSDACDVSERATPAVPAPAPAPTTVPTARVILLTGPSGSGKTRLAARSGLPVLRLDDFYKEGDDPTLPLVGADVDWDSPLSWDADAAVRAITRLCREGAATVPLYDISTSSRTGQERLELADSPLFVAEGIFAADITARCAALGLLADAICLRGRPTTTFRRRLLRDIRESRKPLRVLLTRGWRLLRAEPAIVARHRALGAHACAHHEAAARITRLRRTAALTTGGSPRS
ncbi:uridine kinase [Streptomyces smyrnaeus]|uniref:uridine kinase family protein n=1 Tax=Streptomyces smyrnaeus TaxID=1387713 RepID=UPI0036809AA3